MFGIGSTELLVILLVALIVLGPKSLAKVSRTLGKAVGEFRRVSTDFQRTLNVEAAEAEMREAEKKRKEASEKAQAAEASANPADPKTEGQPAGENAGAEDTPLEQAIASTRKQAEEAAGKSADNS